MGLTGFDSDNQKIMKDISLYLKTIAIELRDLNNTLKQLNGALDLLYKNGLPK